MTDSCVICGETTEHRLAPSHNSVLTVDGTYKASPPFPVCQPHQMDIVHHRLPFPDWCPACDRWRAAPHAHVA